MHQLQLLCLSPYLHQSTQNIHNIHSKHFIACIHNIHHKQFTTFNHTLLAPLGSFLSAPVFPPQVLCLWPNSLHLLHLTVSWFLCFIPLAPDGFFGSAFVFLLNFFGLPGALLILGGNMGSPTTSGQSLGPLDGKIRLL